MKKSFSDVEYSKVTSNMVCPSTMPSKSKGRQIALSSEELDVKCSSGLKEILIESERIYQRTRIQIGVITLVDYNAMAKGIEANDHHRISIFQISHGEGSLRIHRRYSKKDGQEIRGASSSAIGTAGDTSSPARVYQRSQKDDDSFTNELKKQSQVVPSPILLPSKTRKTEGG